MPRVRIIIKGRVQGVFFRAGIREQATARGLAGWVRNRHDGSVEAVAEGPADALDALVEYCKRGPPGAAVRAVDVRDEAERGEFGSFDYRADA